MEKMQEKSLECFIEELAGKASVPGGGGASALAGAIGTALASMVANLTDGKKKYAAYQTDIERILGEAKRLAGEFLFLISEDARVFEPLSKAYGLSKNTPEELAVRTKVMEEALLSASEVPLLMMKTAVEVIALLEELQEKGSVLAISDVGVGAVMILAALKGASLNVFINTRLMQERERAKEFNDLAEEMLHEGEVRCNHIFDAIKGGLNDQN